MRLTLRLLRSRGGVSKRLLLRIRLGRNGWLGLPLLRGHLLVHERHGRGHPIVLLRLRRIHRVAHSVLRLHRHTAVAHSHPHRHSGLHRHAHRHTVHAACLCSARTRSTVTVTPSAGACRRPCSPAQRSSTATSAPTSASTGTASLLVSCGDAVAHPTVHCIYQCGHRNTVRQTAAQGTRVKQSLELNLVPQLSIKQLLANTNTTKHSAAAHLWQQYHRQWRPAAPASSSVWPASLARRHCTPAPPRPAASRQTHHMLSKNCGMRF
jgi:hypothetical protein